MTHWVNKNDDGQVIEIVQEEPIDRQDAANWVEVPKNLEKYVNLDYIVNEEGAVVPPSLDYLNNQLLTELAAIRWDEQVKPVKIRGYRYDTSPDSGNIMNGSIKLAEEYEKTPTNIQDIVENDAEPIYPVFSTFWKTLDGFVEVDLPKLVSIAKIVGSHTQTVFANEGRIAAMIGAANTVDNKIAALDNGIIDRPWSIFTLPNFGVIVPEEELPS